MRIDMTKHTWLVMVAHANPMHELSYNAPPRALVRFNAGRLLSF
jgi:hypothetical protein